MIDTILVLNAGSSSIKFSLFPADERPARGDVLCDGEMEDIGHRVHFFAVDGAGNSLVNEHLRDNMTHEDLLRVLIQWVEDRFEGYRLAAVGHRIVHGGPNYTTPVRIDSTVVAEIRRLIPLAPLHQPHHLAAIDALATLDPTLPQVACFDTAFHHAQPRVATTFALPRQLTADGIRRYGFHGLSYEYIAGVLPDVIGQPAASSRVVVAHLGSGASMCALRDRKSVATTMGFTALDGLPMSRRCGTLDPGVVLYLIQEKKLDAAAVSELLYHDCGLLGVSGISDDMRTLLNSSDPHAAEAVELFVYRIGRELGSLAAALGGLDALIFTAGIGERAAQIRRRVCDDAAWLGLQIDEAANARAGPRITASNSPTSAWVVPTDEDLMIALHTWTIRRSPHVPAI